MPKIKAKGKWFSQESRDKHTHGYYQNYFLPLGHFTPIPIPPAPKNSLHVYTDPTEWPLGLENSLKSDLSLNILSPVNARLILCTCNVQMLVL